MFADCGRPRSGHVPLRQRLDLTELKKQDACTVLRICVVCSPVIADSSLCIEKFVVVEILEKNDEAVYERRFFIERLDIWRTLNPSWWDRSPDSLSFLEMLQNPVPHRLASLAKYETPIWLSKGNNRSKRMRILRLKGQLARYPLLDYDSFCRIAHTVLENNIPISDKKLRQITVSPEYFRRSLNSYLERLAKKYSYQVHRSSEYSLSEAAGPSGLTSAYLQDPANEDRIHCLPPRNDDVEDVVTPESESGGDFVLHFFLFY